jgi:hypothetical protein
MRDERSAPRRRQRRPAGPSPCGPPYYGYYGEGFRTAVVGSGVLEVDESHAARAARAARRARGRRARCLHLQDVPGEQVVVCHDGRVTGV